MVVNNLDTIGSFRGPSKANAVLVVDSNAMLSSSVPGEGLQAIPWGDP